MFHTINFCSLFHFILYVACAFVVCLLSTYTTVLLWREQHLYTHSMLNLQLAIDGKQNEDALSDQTIIIIIVTNNHHQNNILTEMTTVQCTLTSPCVL